MSCFPRCAASTGSRRSPRHAVDRAAPATAAWPPPPSPSATREVFGNVLSQSGSYWWHPGFTLTEDDAFRQQMGWLPRTFASGTRLPLRFYLEVGRAEGSNMVLPNRFFRDLLTARGYEVDYHEFAGGHEYVSWRGRPGPGLIALLGRGPSATSPSGSKRTLRKNTPEREESGGRHENHRQDGFGNRGQSGPGPGAGRGSLRRGAKRVYAGTRQPLTHPDGRVTVVPLDVTNAAQISAAVEKVECLDILINNAAVAFLDDLSDRAVIERHLEVNLFGMYGVTQSFVPLLVHSRGAIVNVLSESAFAPFPLIAAYSISKAAAFSMTQSLRALLRPRGVSVHAALPGPIDTDMSRDANIPKSSADSVARGIFNGMEPGEEEIFPDAKSEVLAESWRSGVGKALERQYAAAFAALTKR